MDEKFVKISITKLIYLLNRDNELSRLEANGVDNWVGYEIDDYEPELWSIDEILKNFEEVK